MTSIPCAQKGENSWLIEMSQTKELVNIYELVVMSSPFNQKLWLGIRVFDCVLMGLCLSSTNNLSISLASVQACLFTSFVCCLILGLPVYRYTRIFMIPKILTWCIIYGGLLINVAIYLNVLYHRSHYNG
jgi:hypothetical protein